MRNIEKDLQIASHGTEEELKMLVYHPSSEVISRMLLNSNITEQHVLLIAGRKNISIDILESLYTDKRWKDSYRVIQALAKNPKTPQKISLSLIKSLRIFDLADLTRNPQIHINVRMRAESIINEKINTLPLGIKLTLARRVSSNVLVRLIEDGIKEVVAVCLDSPHITEGDIIRIINKKKISSLIIRQISEHPKWSTRYDVQYSLIRSNYTPLSQSVKFIEKLKTTDLKELYITPEVPSSTKPFIYRELMDRKAL